MDRLEEIETRLAAVRTQLDEAPELHVVFDDIAWLIDQVRLAQDEAGRFREAWKEQCGENQALHHLILQYRHLAARVNLFMNTVYPRDVWPPDDSTTEEWTQEWGDEYGVDRGSWMVKRVHAAICNLTARGEPA
jgi:hypothetical protein